MKYIQYLPGNYTNGNNGYLFILLFTSVYFCSAARVFIVEVHGVAWAIVRQTALVNNWLDWRDENVFQKNSYRQRNLLFVKL